MHLSARLQSLLDRLRTTGPQSPYKAFVGLDGYVDKIQKVVRAKRPDGNDYFGQISELAGLLHTLAGKSGQIELVTLATKIGGNAPIMAQALASLGVSNRCIGTLSDPVFDQMHRGCELVSLGPPAETNALEFGDGKLIFSEVSVFDRLRWSFLVEQLGIDLLRRQYAESQLVAFVDWANLPHSLDVWAQYLREVVQPAPTDPGRHLFFDLCDPTKRSADSIRQALAIVAQYAPYGHVTLGMNENEARRIYLALHDHSPADALRLAQTPDLPEIARCIREKTTIPAVMIHPIDCSLVATDAGVVAMPGRLVPVPKVLTGGGDNLNAGYCWGLLHGFSLADCLLLGMATSGAYIETGVSPDPGQLMTYLDNWLTEVASN